MNCEGIGSTTVVINQVGYYVNPDVVTELMQMSSKIDRLERVLKKIGYEIGTGKNADIAGRMTAIIDDAHQWAWQGGAA